jgi:hypothetical protein
MTGMLMRVATANTLPSRLDTILLTVCESYVCQIVFYNVETESERTRE